MVCHHTLGHASKIITENVIKILLLDIETSPNTAFVWGLFDQNIPITAIKESSAVLCWSAKWYGEKEIMFDSVHVSSEKKMLKGIHKLLNEADAVVHYNGTRFDIPVLNKEFILNDMTPPAPYKQIDMLRVARGQFRFTSNKLDYVSQALGLGSKTKHAGYQLWVDCMAGDDAAWKKMEEYNKQDVLLLEKVYDKFRPWIKNHPNENLYTDKVVCPVCGGNHLQRRGTSVAVNVVRQRYQCIDCGKWSVGDKVAAQQTPKLKGIN